MQDLHLSSVSHYFRYVYASIYAFVYASIYLQSVLYRFMGILQSLSVLSGLWDCRAIYRSERATDQLAVSINYSGRFPRFLGCAADFRFSFTSLFARQVEIEICVGVVTRKQIPFENWKDRVYLCGAKVCKRQKVLVLYSRWLFILIIYYIYQNLQLKIILLAVGYATV